MTSSLLLCKVEDSKHHVFVWPRVTHDSRWSFISSVVWRKRNLNINPLDVSGQSAVRLFTHTHWYKPGIYIIRYHCIPGTWPVPTCKPMIITSLSSRCGQVTHSSGTFQLLPNNDRLTSFCICRMRLKDPRCLEWATVSSATSITRTGGLFVLMYTYIQL